MGVCNRQLSYIVSHRISTPFADPYHPPTHYQTRLEPSLLFLLSMFSKCMTYIILILVLSVVE